MLNKLQITKQASNRYKILLNNNYRKMKVQSTYRNKKHLNNNYKKMKALRNNHKKN
jgi:hypothetical protein